MLSVILAACAIAATLIMLAARYRRDYLSELLNSFLPYATVLVVGLLVISSFADFSLTTAQRTVVVTGWVLAVLISWPLMAFSFFKPFASNIKKPNIRLASYNKLFSNTNIEGIFYHILKLDVDVVGILELKIDQAKQLTKLAKHHKLYIVIHRYSFFQSRLAIISKHPIKSSQLKPQDNIGVALAANLSVKGQLLTVVLVHTAAPLMPNLLQQRNQGLQNLSQQLKVFDKRPVILMGDFNLTPWSRSYKDFTSSVGNSFYNTAKGRGLRFTWKLVGPLGAHIDHIFSSRQLKCQKFVVDQHLGSDHKLIYADLLL